MLIQIPSEATWIKAGADITYRWMNRRPCPRTGVSAAHIGVAERFVPNLLSSSFIKHGKLALSSFGWKERADSLYFRKGNEHPGM